MHLLKVPKKVGRTNKVPKMYHGVRFPIGELNLSERYPTVGVAIPSAIYPDKAARLEVRSDLRSHSIVYFNNFFKKEE